VISDVSNECSVFIFKAQERIFSGTSRFLNVTGLCQFEKSPSTHLKTEDSNFLIPPTIYHGLASVCLVFNISAEVSVDKTRAVYILHLYVLIHSLVFSPRGRSGRNQSPVMGPIWLLAHCIVGKFLGVVCHCFPPPLDVPTFAATCLCVRSDAAYIQN